MAIPYAHIARMHGFNQSLQYDQRMHAADIKGSIAYSKGLRRVGILNEDEERKIIEGLQAVGKEWEDGVVCVLQTPSSLVLTHSKVQGAT